MGLECMSKFTVDILCPCRIVHYEIDIAQRMGRGLSMGLLCMYHHIPVIPCVYSFPCTVPHGMDRTGHGTSKDSGQRMGRTVHKTVHGTSVYVPSHT